jgi:mRNA interferase MazF
LARFVRGDVVVVPFPFSNLQDSKRRPALVLSSLDGDDLILCQITSQALSDRYALPLWEQDFSSGGLRQTSHIRPNRLFTADRCLVLYRAGALLPAKVDHVLDRLVRLLRPNPPSSRPTG